MHMHNGIVVLEMPRGYSVHEESVSYTDTAGNKFAVPTALLVLLYEGTKHHMERHGRDWKEYTDLVVKNANRAR